MRWSQAFIPTLKEDPTEAEVASHRLMIRAGLIRKLGAGAYTYLPLGFKILKKVENIVREEMDNAGAQELLMPAIHPKELWEKTGRFDLLKEILITYKDRHGKINLLGPTHEEVITDLVAKEIHSYKDLPKILYQIQTKFRDEPRPRFGVLRSKEFIMKDAYSFDVDIEGLDKSYKSMYDAYCRIFDRCGLNYIAVEADPGFMGGDVSHEFMTLSKIGEDIIAACSTCGYKTSLVMAECVSPEPIAHSPETAGLKTVKEVGTPGVSTVEKVSEFLKVKPDDLVKTLIYKADGKSVAILIRGDHNLNEAKLKRYLNCQDLVMADDKLIMDLTGGPMGFSGPVGLKGVRLIADYSISGMKNFVTGANKSDTHLINVNLQRDFKVGEWADLRYIDEKDLCSKCKKERIKLEPAIEVGHTFKLGTKYSKDLKATFLDKGGKEKSCIMGCYGIGINRIIAAAIEQNNDKDGIIWPSSISPYQVLIIEVESGDRDIVNTSESLYKTLSDNGLEVLVDDRTDRAGIKFKDADLIGIPLQIIIGPANLKKKSVEIKTRKDNRRCIIPLKEITSQIKKLLS